MTKTEAYNDSVQFLGVTRKSGVKAAKLYTQKPLTSADAFSVSRALAAYRTNQEGVLELMGTNVPRIDFANGCPEILIENEATNKIFRSEEFDNAYWAKANITVTANSLIAPNDAVTADTLTEAAVNSSFHVDSANTTVTNGSTYTISAFVKMNGRRYVLLYEGFSDIGVFFDLQSGVKLGSLGAGTLVDSDIEVATNGFYRISVTYLQSGATASLQMYLSSNGTGVGYVGDGTSGIYAWGAQLEETYSYRATSYIPTTTVAVTRPADVIENDTIDYTQDAATIFVRANLTFSESIQGLITLYDGGALDDYVSLWIVESGGDKLLAIDTYTNPDQNTVYVTLPNDGIYSIALAYNLLTGEYSLAVNGTIESTGTFVNNLPTSNTLTTLTLGRIGASYDARVIGSMFFDSKLDDTSLENLTLQ